MSPRSNHLVSVQFQWFVVRARIYSPAFLRLIAKKAGEQRMESIYRLGRVHQKFDELILPESLDRWSPAPGDYRTNRLYE